jgi:hypothetical protein
VASRRGCRPVKVGVEAAGHYHRALLGSGVWPAGWEVVELSPARASEQRRVHGRRRVKTDVIDLEAITELGAGWSWDPMMARAAAPNSGVGDAPFSSTAADLLSTVD